MTTLPTALAEAIDKLDDLARAATGCGGSMQAEIVRNYVRRIRRAMEQAVDAQQADQGTTEQSDTIKQRAQACAGAIVPECVALYGGHSIRPWIVDVAVPVIQDEIAQAVIDMGAQKELDGLRRAISLACPMCSFGDEAHCNGPKDWRHWNEEGTEDIWCPSSAVHDLIAEMENNDG